MYELNVKISWFPVSAATLEETAGLVKTFTFLRESF